MTDTAKALELIDAIQAEFNRTCADMRAVLRDGPPATVLLDIKEPTACPGEMVAGGWIRFPGSRVGREITRVIKQDHKTYTVHYCYGGRDKYQWVRHHEALPYLTASQREAGFRFAGEVGT